MKAFRRSKADSGGGKHISITPKSAIAIVPPKKVIKALYDYQPNPDDQQNLAFSKGDFFHVISREDDPAWYEACNPLIPTARGLVPVSYFEIIGKTERQSGGSVASGASSIIPQQYPHDSGYSEKTGPGRQESTSAPRAQGHTRMSSVGKSSGAMVYGVVQYDFNAERPDELEAKAGEAIVVIAQSNPEWFVAKPIGRLGGPGLIPVSFIEIRDVATQEPVADPQAAVARAGVPKVEEWKKMARDYKDSSISLGKIEAASAQRETSRTSLNNGSQPYNCSNGSSQSQTYHQRNASRSTQNGIDRQSSRNLLAPISASIPRYCFENDKYWYIIECNLEDGSLWELCRFYQNFYDFQIALLREFPKEADSNGGTRILPYMPGPVTYVTDAISNGRRESLNDYVKKLLLLPPYISKCHLVRELFAPREGDFELDPRAMGEDYRFSNGSQQSSATGSLSRTASRQSSRSQVNGVNGYPAGSMGPPSHRISHQRSITSVPGPSGSSPGFPNHRNQTDYPSQAAINRQPSSLTQASENSSGTHHSTPATSAPNTSSTNVAASGALKIKVFFEDDLIAIRVPSNIRFQDLRKKLKDRLKIQEDIMVQYKDEPSSSYAELLSDRDLDVALGRNSKLTLYKSQKAAVAGWRSSVDTAEIEDKGEIAYAVTSSLECFETNGDTNPDAWGPLNEYDERVHSHQLREDEHQRGIVQSLQDLHDTLGDYRAPKVVHPSIQSLKPPARSFLASLFQRKPPKRPSTKIPSNVPRGLYMYGDVGSGKTMLMDMFYDTLPHNISSKTRVHFHNFMQDVHHRLHILKMEHGNDLDAIQFVAADLAEKGSVLCFDEFQCTDVADAMILRSLLEALMSHGVVLVTTSNRHPDDLYKNGIQRASFIPCINLLKTRLRILNLDSTTDYRKIPRPPSGVYHHPLDKAAVSHADRWFRFFGDPENDPAHAAKHRVWGREIEVAKASGKAAMFTFRELIGRATGAADYLELMRSYDAFIITDVPGMTHKSRDWARRFITFIDAIYESRAKLVLTTEVPLFQLFMSASEVDEALEDGRKKGTVQQAEDHEGVDDVMRQMMDDLGMNMKMLKNSSLFSGDEERFAFSRALSRLSEMGSQEWVERGMGLEHKGGLNEKEGWQRVRSRWREDSL